MVQTFSPGFLVHLYDELSESQPVFGKAEYQKYLMLWGMQPVDAKSLMSEVRCLREDRMSREDLCKALVFLPKKLPELRDVDVIECDIPIRKSESIQMIAVQVLNSGWPELDSANEIKNQVEKVYGSGWNVFIVKGHYWGICGHQPGSQLVFSRRGIIVGIYQTPQKHHGSNGTKKREDSSTAHTSKF